MLSTCIGLNIHKKMVVPIPQDSIEVSLLKMIGSSGIPWVINLITNINNHSNIKI